MHKTLQMDDKTEIVSKTVEGMIWAFSNCDKSISDKNLVEFEVAYNYGVHFTTLFTPFFLNYGIHQRTIT